MLFKRRKSATFFERMRISLWPRRSWSRSSRYVVHRLRRLHGTPHAIAIGFAAGVFSAMTPFLGTHLVMAALLAWIIGGSIVAAALGTFVGNPLTYPFMWYSSFWLGNLMLGADGHNRIIDLSAGIFQTSFAQLWPILKPMSLGAIPLGIAAAAVAYVAVRPVVVAYQHRRDRLRQERAREEQRQMIELAQ